MKSIKSYFIILLIALLFFPISCKDDVIDLLTTPLEGTVWIVKSFASAGCDDSNNNGTETITCDASNCSKATFVNGTLTITDIEAGVTTSDTETYTVSGNTITITASDGSTDVYTFTIVLNTLTLVGDGEDPGCTDTITLEKQS